MQFVIVDGRLLVIVTDQESVSCVVAEEGQRGDRNELWQREPIHECDHDRGEDTGVLVGDDVLGSPVQVDVLLERFALGRLFFVAAEVGAASLIESLKNSAGRKSYANVNVGVDSVQEHREDE